MSEHLLPCPFCGEPALLEKDSDHHGAWFNLGCSGDGCPGRWVFYTCPLGSLGDAVAKWNSRRPTPAYANRNGETDAPTEAGCYWFSGTCTTYAQLEIAFMVDVTGGLVYIGDGPYKPDVFAGQWWGPISPPWGQSA